jgi:hypothetical protein
LTTHLWILNEELGWKQDWITRKEWKNLGSGWVRLCAVFPFYERAAQTQTDPLKNQLDDRNEFSKLVIGCGHPLGEGCDSIHFVQKLDMESFSSRLEDILNLPSTQMTSIDPLQRRKFHVEYLRFAVWCLLHSFGVVLSHRSELIDKEHAEMCTTSPVQGVDPGMPPRTKLALLSSQQMYILTNAPSVNKPILIMGRAGTGKTFLLVEKIKQLHQLSKREQRDFKALVVVRWMNHGLYWQLRDKLSHLGDRVHICPVNGGRKALTQELKDAVDRRGIQYVFVDQLEDFINPEMMEVLKVLEAFHRLLSTKLQLLWFLWNGKAYLSVLEDSDYIPKMSDDEQRHGKGTTTCSTYQHLSIFCAWYYV